MIETALGSQGLWISKRNITVSVICAAIFGSLISVYLQSSVTNSEVQELGNAATRTVTEIDGTYSIAYRTTGPIFTDSYLGCSPLPEWYGIFPDHNCLVLNYDGTPGIVELMIPSEVVKEFPPIDSARLSVFRSLPFQKVSQDDLFTIVRIDLPAGYHYIELVGGSFSPITNIILFASVCGLIIFVVTLVIFGLCSNWINTLKNKRSNTWKSIVNKETREAIRTLYLDYLGAHSITKKLDLDVNVVIDVLRGYGIKGREF